MNSDRLVEALNQDHIFYAPLLPNANFVKREAKTNHRGQSNWSPGAGNPHSQPLHYLSSSAGQSQYFKYPSIKSCNNTGDILFLRNCANYQIPHPSSRVASNSNRTKTTAIGLIINKHSTHTKYTKSLAKRLWLPIPWRNTRKSWTHLPPSFFSIISETKRYSLRFIQCLCFVQLLQQQKEELIYQANKANTQIRAKSWKARCSLALQDLSQSNIAMLDLSL